MLFYGLSLLTGAIIAAMVAVNGVLTSAYGVYVATVIIHIVGLVFISLAVLIRREKPIARRRLPLWFYLGGVIGVCTTVFNNLAFNRISLSALVALGLLGQAVSSLFIDQFGLFGMEKRGFHPTKLAGVLFMFLGSGYMLLGASFALMPVVVSLLAGVCVVLSRTVNARLAAGSSELVSTWYNYVVGILMAILALLALGMGELSALPALSGPIWAYAGGLLGVFVVLLLNVTVARISALYMTLLLFMGQMFAGVVIDMLLTQSFSPQNLAGGALVAMGMALNLWLDQKVKRMA